MDQNKNVDKGTRDEAYSVVYFVNLMKCDNASVNTGAVSSCPGLLS